MTATGNSPTRSMKRLRRKAAWVLFKLHAPLELGTGFGGMMHVSNTERSMWQPTTGNRAWAPDVPLAVVVVRLDQVPHVGQAGVLVLAQRVRREAALAYAKGHRAARGVEADAHLPVSAACVSAPIVWGNAGLAWGSFLQLYVSAHCGYLQHPGMRTEHDLEQHPLMHAWATVPAQRVSQQAI